MEERGRLEMLRNTLSGRIFQPDSMLTLFTVIASGLLLGQFRVGGLSLGSSGVIFSALIAGHLGYAIPGGIGPLGLVLFIYGVGLTAGPSFFRSFKKLGKPLAALATVLVASGAATAWGCAYLLGLPPGLAAGMFAGALTSTPGLAAVVQALPPDSQAAVGYGLAYPLGVVGVVLFVQALPRVLRLDLQRLDHDLKASESARREIRRVLVQIRNPAVFGKALTELEFIPELNCQITRILRDGELHPVGRSFTLEEGQVVLLLGRAFRLEKVVPLLGVLSSETQYALDTDRQRSRIVATSANVVGKSLGELSVLGRFGVTISRFERHDLEFVPDPEDVIQWGDALHVVGEPDALAAFADFAGHREHAFDATDLVSLALGILLGVGLGSVSIGVGTQQFSLGLVGGPMLVALVAAHFGRIGRINASVPRASRLLMLELGLVLFLAQAGTDAGSALFSVLATFGWQLMASAVLVVLVPMVIGVVVARRILHLDYLRIVGGVCGGMTSTPGIGAIAAAIQSDLPVVAYAAAYPVALILMTLVGRLLVAVL